jgi:Na+-translocating ferredoxin:NAD+ oxidoreductase RNF subunit RnfB
MTVETFALVGLGSGLMLALAVAGGAVLGWANRKFHVPVDPRVDRVNAVLPAANCGNCGFIGCMDYAEAVVAGRAVPTLCAPGGPVVANAVGAVLGVDVGETWPYRAVVHCTATTSMRLGRTEYRGEQTCGAANLVTGVQGCTYGCLGLADCVRVCDYDAIHVIDGVARVDYRKCTGCGDCVAACPRNLITRVPFKAERMLVVGCANLDFGNDVKAVCTIGCIGCKACAKLAPQLVMKSNLPVLDYDAYDAGFDFVPAIDKCPAESLLWVGKPTPKDLAAVEAETLPVRVEADFKTTVDKTEWWG